MSKLISALPKNLLCFSHLRWDFVFQRPQHLMTRFAKEQHVFFLEEPVFDAQGRDYLAKEIRDGNITLLIPHLAVEKNQEEAQRAMSNLLSEFLAGESMREWIFWYYTPMALQFSLNHRPELIIFDCMDELSAFDFAPKELLMLEKKLMDIADVVFTGGHSLYEAKKNQHNNIFAFPSSIDKTHFASSREEIEEPEDQAKISGTKLGFFGVIDERFEINLIEHIAAARPDWQLILLGPVVKISQDTLPRRANIHYLGQKSYQQLPAYLSGWDVALIPFKLNESTRFISPTKTPEYLAAGVRVVSTPIRDVVKPYGTQRLVSIAEHPEDFVQAVEQELNAADEAAWLSKVDHFLSDKSWEHTFSAMKLQMLTAMKRPDTLLAS
ncbi:glycosyltransferase family 1 protein [Pedobacter sp. N23S346]|uniref:glycosyltransferase family 1 protein n=1 Tax=Pedobacter sp. N23S346 TaxID=3402750 RepID=UPI003ABF4B00